MKTHFEKGVHSIGKSQLFDRLFGSHHNDLLGRLPRIEKTPPQRVKDSFQESGRGSFHGHLRRQQLEKVHKP